MKAVATLVLAGAALAAALPAQAQFAKPEDAVKYRQSALTVMARHYGIVAQMANGRIPFNAAAAAENAAIAETLSKLPWAGFVDGSSNAKTKPEIWSNAAGFKKASEDMQAEMHKFATVAKTGNVDQIKAAAGAVGASCKACHDNFRN
jgi:cytochrome c556